MKKNKKAVVLVSGGMDSLVTAAIAHKEYETAFLHLNYGQRTQKREIRSFIDIADYYNVKERLVVDLSYLADIGGSSLTEKSFDVPLADVDREGIPNSYVPFRNANLISPAVSWAEVIGASRIFIGAVEEDSSGYPDCREVFYNAFNKVIHLGTRPESNIIIEIPVIHLKKHEIVKKGMKMNVPFELSWSCYQNEEIACGICDSCALRLRAFELAGVQDPIQYEKRPSYV